MPTCLISGAGSQIIQTTTTTTATAAITATAPIATSPTKNNDIKKAAIVKPSATAIVAPSTATSLKNDYMSMLPTSGSVSVAAVPPKPIGQIAGRHRASVSGPIGAGSPEKIVPVVSNNQLPNASEWLGQVVKSTSPSPRRAPALGVHSRARSLSSANDPFDSEWANDVTRNDNNLSTTAHHSTNPFIQPPKPPVQSFQVQL